MDCDAAIVPQVHLGRHLEFGLESQRLALFEVDVRHVGAADDFQLFLFKALLKMLRDQTLCTSWRTLSAKRVCTILAGTFPGRKPGSLAFFWMSAITRSVSRAISSTGTVISSSCLQPSISMGTETQVGRPVPLTFLPTSSRGTLPAPQSNGRSSRPWLRASAWRRDRKS